MRRTTAITIVLLLTIITLASGCLSNEKTYTKTVTTTTTTTQTQHTTIEMVASTTTTTTITVRTTTTIIKTENTTINSTTTTTTTTYMYNVTHITKTTIVTFYYGDDGKPNIVYYSPTTGKLQVKMDISVTTVYYPTEYSPLYTPILPVFIFYDKKYYSLLTKELGVSHYPGNPEEYISIMNHIKSRVVIVKSWTYPNYIDAEIDRGTLNEIELANYFAGVAILNSKTPTLVLISNYTASTMGVIVDGIALIGTRIFGNTAAMKAYYYNLISNHVEYYAAVNIEYPTITVTEETISSGPELIGMKKTRLSYTITVTMSLTGEEATYTRTGTFNNTWGSYIETTAMNTTITAYIHNSTIYLITNTFTTNTYPQNPAAVTRIFLPEPFRENDVYYYGKTEVLLENYDPINGIWLIITVDNTTATGTFVDKNGETIGYYRATFTLS